MPITYQIDVGQKMIRTKCAGQVSLPDVVEHFQTLSHDPQCPARLDVFLDVSEVETLPDARQILAVVTELKKVRSKVLFDACAILAGGDAIFGMMRMFEAQAEGLFRITRTFRSAPEADAWLASQRSAVQTKAAADS